MTVDELITLLRTVDQTLPVKLLCEHSGIETIEYVSTETKYGEMYIEIG